MNAPGNLGGHPGARSAAREDFQGTTLTLRAASIGCRIKPTPFFVHLFRSESKTQIQIADFSD